MSQKFEKEEVMESVTNCDQKTQQNDHVIVEKLNSEQERLIFSESIKNLEGNKLTKLNEKNKSLEPLTPNKSDTEWLKTDGSYLNTFSHEFLPITILQTGAKECCMPTCSNTEITEPEKIFHPLPTERNELNTYLNKIGLYEIEETNSFNFDNNCHQYYICSDHIASCQASIVSKDNLDSGYHICPLTTGLSSLSVSVVDENDLNYINETKQNEIWKLPSTPGRFSSPGIVASTPEVTCRLCGRCTSEPISIYSEKENDYGYKLVDKLNFCLPVTISMLDKLSKYICLDCKRRVTTFFDLAILSMETERKLLQARDEKKIIYDPDHGCVKCPLCGEGKIKSKHKIGNPSVNYFNACVTKKLLESKKPMVYSNNNNNDEVKKYDICCPALDGTLITDDDDQSNKSEDFDCADDDTHTIVPENYIFCPGCLTNFLSTESHKCETHVKKEEKLSKRSRDCIENVKLELNANISEDSIDYGRPAKQMKFDTHYENWFECNTCFTTFNSRDKLTDHLNSHRLKRPIKHWCDFCQAEFPHLSSLKKHISTEHEEKYLIQNKCYKCTGCCRVFTKEDDAFTHATRLCSFILDHEKKNNATLIHEVYIGNVYICEYCNECYSLPTTLHEHRQRCHLTEDFSCSRCNKSFLFRKDLLMHKEKTEHFDDLGVLWINRYFVCKFCNKTFIHYSSFLSHVARHQGSEPYLCRICDRRFSNFDEVEAHRGNAHNYQLILQELSNKSYICHYCQKEYDNEFQLAQHIRSHTVEQFSRRTCK